MTRVDQLRERLVLGHAHAAASLSLHVPGGKDRHFKRASKAASKPWVMEKEKEEEEEKAVSEYEGLQLHLNPKNLTGYVGVHRHANSATKPYVARLEQGGKVHLGTFATALEAAVAYAQAKSLGAADGVAEEEMEVEAGVGELDP